MKTATHTISRRRSSPRCSLTFISSGEILLARDPGTGGDSVDMAIDQFRPGSPGTGASGRGVFSLAAVGMEG